MREAGTLPFELCVYELWMTSYIISTLSLSCSKQTSTFHFVTFKIILIVYPEIVFLFMILLLIFMGILNNCYKKFGFLEAWDISKSLFICIFAMIQKC